MNSELHPLEPFLPANARVLMLGSFPPKRIRCFDPKAAEKRSS